MISIAQLRAFAPGASTNLLSGIVANQKLLVDANITTSLRLAHFMAQIAHETGGLHQLEENLNYSAKRLTEVWPTRFRTMVSAQPYAKNPQALANKVYGGRLGNKGKDDGWNYRGSGMLQTTGRDNFAEVKRATGLDVVADPDLLRTFPGALEAATIYWAKRNINKLADRDDINGVTRAINGGQIGLADRKVWLKKAKEIKWTLLHIVGKAVEAVPALDPTSPSPEPEPAPTVAPAAALVSREVVAKVQVDLIALQYNPGGSDGIMGPLTKGAIMAFRNDNGMPVIDTIDDELLLKLQTAKPRAMIPARANATPAQVAGMVPEARAHWWSRLVAGVMGIGTTVGGAVEYIAPATGYLQPVRELFTDVPTWVWITGGAVICGALYMTAEYGVKKATLAYQTGDRR